jgi:alpha-L-arabinofuranosidase
MKKFHFIFCLFVLLTTKSFTQTATVSVRDVSKDVINKNIYGHFSEDLGRCIYDGFFRNGRIRMDIVDALKKIKLPMLRWPGGCFADQYHWSDGIGPVQNRKTTVNTTWGMVTDNNSFGTHEFLELCGLIGCDPYIAGNVGTGTPQEMENWLEYLNYDGKSSLTLLRAANGHPAPYHVSYWGVGNESWGCGGSMTPELYSDKFKQYAEFCKNYPGSPLFKIASGANADDYAWTETCMKKISTDQMQGISLHYYTQTDTWENKGSATSFTEAEYFKTMKNALKMEDLVQKHSGIMDKYDPEKKVALVVDEWGIWTRVEPGTNPAFLYQQNSLRDALIAGTTLNIFNNHCDRVRIANLAQTVNVLQALVLTQGDKMLLTPTYYVFDLYKVHQGAKKLNLALQSPQYTNGSESITAVNLSASLDSSGAIHFTFVNLDPNHAIHIQTTIGMTFKTITGQVLTSSKLTDINTFDQPGVVGIQKFNGFKKTGDGIDVDLPAKSIVALELK